MPGSFRGVLYELHLSWNSLIRRYKIGEKLSDEFVTTWVFLSVEKRFLTTAQQRGIRERRLFFLKLTCLEVFEACYMSSICHGIWVVRQYDILVLTNDNYILLMTRPMPGPWQTISQSDETIEVDISTRGWWFQYWIWLLKIVRNLLQCMKSR